MTWFHFIRNFPAGAFFGTLIGIAFMAVLGSNLSDNATKYGTYALTALVSLFASAVALTTAIWRTETDQLRKMRASRASLPLALSKLIEISKKGFCHSQEDNDFFSKVENAERVASDLEIPDAVFSTLKDCIEHTDTVTAQWLANVIAHYQVYRVRLLTSFDEGRRNVQDDSRAQHAAEWVFWNALVSHLFDYARGAQQTAPSIDPRKFGVGFTYELAGNRLQSKIIAELEFLKSEYTPFDAVSIQQLA